MSVVFAGGGTYGPTASLVPIIEAVQKESGIGCHFVAPRGSQGRELIERIGVSWHEIPAGKLQRYPSFGWLSLLPNIIRGYLAAGTLLSELNASVVVTSGSYVSPPVIWQAKKQGIPIVVIQLDIETGLANRLSLPYASKRFFAYPVSDAKDDEVVGPILPGRALSKGAPQLPPGFEAELPTIFITGGGTGAKAINEVVWELLPALTNRANVVHTTGKGKNDPRYEFKRYIQKEVLPPDEYYRWFSAAQLVIGRSGMGFFSDCIAFNKPAITIPMFDTHQEANARFFKERRAVLTPTKAEYSSAWLLASVDTLLTNPVKKEELKSAIGSFAKQDTIQMIAHSIIDLHG